jgi:hypothetical protein
MMWRKVVLTVVIGLLVSGFSSGVLAERPPTRGWNIGPGPRPVQWGDPDWPAFCDDFGLESRVAVDDTGAITPESVSRTTDRARQGSIRRHQGRRGLPPRRFEARILGTRVAIRR